MDTSVGVIRGITHHIIYKCIALFSQACFISFENMKANQDINNISKGIILHFCWHKSFFAKCKVVYIIHYYTENEKKSLALNYNLKFMTGFWNKHILP